MNFDLLAQPFVKKTVRLRLPSARYAFNPSLVRWRDHYLMVYRQVLSPMENVACGADSCLSIVRLDSHWRPLAPAQLFKGGTVQPSRADDARLVVVQDRLYIVYSDNLSESDSDGNFRMQVAELEDDGESFSVVHSESLTQFEGESPSRREKNWVPFDYAGNLMLAYSLMPHKILYPHLDGSSACTTYVTTYPSVVWEWGELRGGTPALAIDERHYLSFFHSCQELSSQHSQGNKTLHYFMGAYLFEREPPFRIRWVSPEPICGRNFYEGRQYVPYWKPVNAIFPCGLVDCGEHLWVSYGRQDHEMWLVKIEKKALLESLVHVSSCAP